MSRPSRRDVLAGATAAALVGCSGDPELPPPGPQPAPDRPPEPEPWEAPGTWDDVAFAWGVQVGDVTSSAALLSVRSTEPTLALTVVKGVGGVWEEVHTASGLSGVDDVVQLELTGLDPDTVYRLVFASEGGPGRSPVARFRTAVDDDAFRKLAFGATSCLGSSNPDFPSLAFAAQEDLDFFLLLGDTVYADGSNSLEDYRWFWRRALSTPTVRDLLASTSLVATWDDHEVENNWMLTTPLTPEQTRITEDQLAWGTAAFREALPQRVGPGGTGMWRTLRWGTVAELFVLDCRAERDWDTRMVSDEQLAWIEDALAQSTATFKIVMASVHVTDHDALLGFVAETDRWQGYPEQRQRLVRACVDAPGTVVITGDMHYGGIQLVDPAGAPGADLHEVAVGPAGSRIFGMQIVHDLAAEPNPQYLDLIEDWTWTRFIADPGTSTLVVQFVNDIGAVVAERTLLVG